MEFRKTEPEHVDITNMSISTRMPRNTEVISKAQVVDSKS